MGSLERAAIIDRMATARSVLTSRIDRVTDSNLVQWNNILLR